MSSLISTDNNQNDLLIESDRYVYDESKDEIVRYDYYSSISGDINELLSLTADSLNNLNSVIIGNLNTADLSYQVDISGYLYELSNNTVEFKNL